MPHSPKRNYETITILKDLTFIAMFDFKIHIQNNIERVDYSHIILIQTGTWVLAQFRVSRRETALGWKGRK